METKISASQRRACDFLNRLEPPNCVRFWRNNQESYLTLSVVIADQKNPQALKKIVELQTEVTERLEGLRVVHDPYAQEGKCLYTYPKQELHCSLVNILLSPHTFPDFVETMRNREFVEQRNKIIKCIGNNKPPRSEATIAGFYSGGSHGPTNSFSLQMFPDPEFIAALKRIRDCLTPEAIGKLPEGVTLDSRVKGYSGSEDSIERFPLNILRLMHRADSDESPGSAAELGVKMEIARINAEFGSSKERWLTLTIKKLVLVESDPFLHNPNRLAEFSL